MISLTLEGSYIHLQDLIWPSDALQPGLSVKLKEVPFRVQLFKVVAPHGDIEWVITNHPSGVLLPRVVVIESQSPRMGQDLDAAQRDLFSDYLRAGLRQPHIPAFLED